MEVKGVKRSSSPVMEGAASNRAFNNVTYDIDIRFTKVLLNLAEGGQ